MNIVISYGGRSLMSSVHSKHKMDIVMYLNMMHKTNLWDCGSACKDSYTRRISLESRSYTTKAQNGHCNVSTKDVRNKSLGQWVKKQRQLYKKNALDPDRIQQLNSIGFIWDLK
uniref:Helicase-associated domain-containing protein n=1 Tax=Ditylum brightwellii TaxID=49249 RepID=A0A7S4SME1_9STRA